MRKEVIITLEDDGASRMFRIRQMPAVKQERWINRIVTLLLGGGAINNITLSGLQEKFAEGKFDELLKVFGSLKFEDIEPLYNELLECCEYIPDQNDRKFSNPMTAETIGSVIMDFRNLYKLRLEALKVNFSFFSIGESSPKDTEEPTIRISKGSLM